MGRPKKFLDRAVGVECNGKGYYTVRNPADGIRTGVGYDLTEANEVARMLYESFSGKSTARSKADKILGLSKMTFAEYVPKYLLKKKGKSATYKEQLERYCNIFLAAPWACKPLDDIRKVDIQEILDTRSATKREAKYLLTTIRNIWAEAIRDEIVKESPAKKCTVDKYVPARERIPEWEDALRILNHCKQHFPPWVYTAVALGMLTGQRPSDVLKMKYTDIGKDGKLYILQGKTKHEVYLPDMHIGDLVMSDVIADSKNCVSRFIVHHHKSQGPVKRGGSLSQTTVSSYFTQAIKAVGIGRKKPPTYYECRSLSARVYFQQYQDVQLVANILGDSLEMTYRYLNPRTTEFHPELPDEIPSNFQLFPTKAAK